MQGEDLNMISCNESGNYHPILIKRPGSELLEDCKQLVWLQSRTERFPRKVGGGEGGAKEGESRHRVDSGKKLLVPLPGLLQQNELAKATASYEASNGGDKRKQRTNVRLYLAGDEKNECPFQPVSPQHGKDLFGDVSAANGAVVG